ncbi:MAG: hypothetical protein IPN01_27805 [Deltaproteobacteria bacterium]|nr:hypothetical protein [Deltaproteobacteria bacterium]
MDCDDTIAIVHPGAKERVYNGHDDDCNPATPDDDLDRDGFALAEDCNDRDSRINPDANEILYNGIDEDCDATTLDDDLDGDGFDAHEDCDEATLRSTPTPGPHRPRTDADPR